MNQGVKTNLAKLLATENLVVEHANVETASFDVVNRVLTLPVWEASENVYDMLVGHEVGHALYTPNEMIDSDIPTSYVNVVEDARIERMIKSTYPGLIKSFASGYKELIKKDFFEIAGKDLREFNLIDRINLYFKIGIADVSCVIPFKEEEKKFIELTRTATTFAEVCKIAREIHEFMQLHKTKKETDIKVPDVELNSTGRLQNADQTVPASPEKESEKEKDEDQIEETPDQLTIDPKQPWDSLENDLDEVDDLLDAEEEEDDMEVSTQSSFNRNQKKLLSKDTWSTINPPECDWESYITSNDQLVDDMNYAKTKLKDKVVFTYSLNSPAQDQKLIEKYTQELNEYKLSSKKEVNFLVKEFEMKKSASAYARSTTSKTGVLDTAKLHTYKFNEDLFKKVSVVPDGKNHGLMMFVDWSGSMHNELLPTIKQLFNIVQFCKKVNIPFEVYSFVENRASEGYYGGKQYSKCSGKNNTIAVNDCFHLVQFFDSQSKTKLDVQMDAVWMLTKMTQDNFIHGVDGMGVYEMGGTPLNETIFAASYLYKKFVKNTKVEKVNTVFLTDGESNHLTANKLRKDEDGREWTSRSHVGQSGTSVNFNDPKSGYQQHKLVEPGYDSWSARSFDVTSKLIQYYRWITGSNVVGYRLCNEKPAAITRFQNNRDEFTKVWRKNGYVIEKNLGYNELYIIKMGKSFGEVEEMNANSNSTKSKLRNEFKKHIKSKSFHKILLSKFVDQIA